MTWVAKIMFSGAAVLAAASTCRPAGTVEITVSPPDATDAEIARSALPPLCDLDGGRWCQPCGPEGCPTAGKAGALCCKDEECVVWSGGKCDGELGWCPNYTTERDATGVTVATCHEEGEK